MATAGLGKLMQAEKDLRSQWENARADWRDENARQFEQNFVSPLLARLRNVESALVHLGAVLQEARRDCG